MSNKAATMTELAPKIVVLGVGGAGGNAINNMIASKLQGVHFVAANTDAQALSRNRAPTRIQLGGPITEGLGAGARPEIGAQAAEHSIDEVMAAVGGAHMLFITAGMGGGTGTGGAPVIARAARKAGVLTVAVVTKPFHFEGRGRMTSADRGIAALDEHVDTLITIPNQNLFRVASEKTTVTEAFLMADEVLHSGVRGITDLMTRPGLINLDFADVRTVMNEMGKAMMGTGEAGGDRRAVEAAHAAVCNPLLDEVTLKGARAVLINITGSSDLTLYEVDEAANEIRSEVDPDATIIIGSALDETLEGRVRVSVVATGIEAEAVLDERQAARERIKRRLLERDIASANAQSGREHDDEAPQAFAHTRAEEARELASARVAESPTAEAKRGGRLGLFGLSRKPAKAASEPHKTPTSSDRALSDRPSRDRAAGSSTVNVGGRQTDPLASPARGDRGEILKAARRDTGREQEYAPVGDGGISDDDLEIPAFLRRQA